MVSVPHAARALTDALQGTRRKRSVEGRLADQGRATDVRFQTAQRPTAAPRHRQTKDNGDGRAWRVG